MSLLSRSGWTELHTGTECPLQDPAVSAFEVWEKGGEHRIGFLANCSNRNCRSGWLHVWRDRSGPVFEGGWTCSPECTGQRLAEALSRELHGRSAYRNPHRHRVPLGLLLLEQGWITAGQLQRALNVQRERGRGRLGEWLISMENVEERVITQGLSLQWSCPVLMPGPSGCEIVRGLVPGPLLEAFGALPLRGRASGTLYLGFEDGLDRVLAFAVSRMLGRRVECGIIPGSLFGPAQRSVTKGVLPMLEMIDAASHEALVYTLTQRLERFKPHQSRLVRVRDWLWMRMSRESRPGRATELSLIQDVLCNLPEAS